MRQVAISLEITGILFSVAWRDYEYFYSPVDGMQIHRMATLSIMLASTHLYT